MTERAVRGQWAGLAVLALPLFVLSVDMSVLYLAAPALTANLAPSATPAALDPRRSD